MHDPKPETGAIIDPSGGSNQSRVRAYNERLVLSLIRRHGGLPKSEIARRTGLSAQTASVIMRALEKDGLLLRGEPQRGRVGQPSVPMSLNPDGAYSIGLKIGRRSADLVLVDFLGQQKQSVSRTYLYPTPEQLLQFVQAAVDQLSNELTADQNRRVAGIGVSMPFELWNWPEKVGAPAAEMNAWKTIDFQATLSQLTAHPVFVQNDATAACGAELVFGRGAEFSNFVYLFVGTFVGGGVVLNNAVYSGQTGNAGALGSMPMIDAAGKTSQLIDHASLLTLEHILKNAGIDPTPLWMEPESWNQFGNHIADWIAVASKHLAVAIVSACSVIDFQAAIVDGGFPENVRGILVEAVRREMALLDLQGLEVPEIYEGAVGRGARAVGGASLPFFARYLLDQSVLFKELS